MGSCELECSDVYDSARFYSEAIAILRALLGSTATTDTEISILYDDQGGGVYVPFYRYTTVECDGEIVITDYELSPDGEGALIPYTPVGHVIPEIPDSSSVLVHHNQLLTSLDSLTISDGYVQAAFAVIGDTAEINGVVYPAGSTLNLPPMSYGSVEQLYPETTVANINGTVIAYWITKT